MDARRIMLPFLAFVLMLGVIVPAAARAQQATPEALPAGVDVVVAGLDSPRGFDWSADGTLHIALAGRGGDTRFEIADGFTLKLGMSSSVATVADGCATTVAPGLVSAHWVEPG
jgi:hypothetical protein